jgi:hypothetical protein
MTGANAGEKLAPAKFPLSPEEGALAEVSNAPARLLTHLSRSWWGNTKAICSTVQLTVALGFRSLG